MATGTKLYFERSAVKNLDRIPKKDFKRSIYRIDLLREDPRPPGCEKLFAQKRYRVRQENYPIIYSIQDGVLTIWMVKIGNTMFIDRLLEVTIRDLQN